MPNDPTTQTKKWADSLLLNEHLKLIKNYSKEHLTFPSKQNKLRFISTVSKFY